MPDFRLFLAMAIPLAVCSASWAQPLKPLTYSRKTLYHDFGLNDSIKVHNPNHTPIRLDSVEFWGESRAKNSLLGLYFPPLGPSAPLDGTIRVYLPQNMKSIDQGIFTSSSSLALDDRNLGVPPNGDAWFGGFLVDRCPTCKQGAGAVITDTLRFKLILHHAIAADTILIITDDRIGLSLSPWGGRKSMPGGGKGTGFDFLGRRAPARGFHAVLPGAVLLPNQ